MGAVTAATAVLVGARSAVADVVLGNKSNENTTVICFYAYEQVLKARHYSVMPMVMDML